LRDRLKTKSFSNIKLIFWGFFLRPQKIPGQGYSRFGCKDVFFGNESFRFLYTVFGVFSGGRGKAYINMDVGVKK
jgi:hypothetical protein